MGGCRNGRRGGPNRSRSIANPFGSGRVRLRQLLPHLRARARGRLLLDSDDVQGAPMVALMSHETWQREFNADPAVIGGTFWVNTKAVTVVGAGGGMRQQCEEP